MNRGIGLDIGTNMLVAALMGEGGRPIYRKERDAFFRLTPKSEVNKKSIRMSLEGRRANFIIDGDDFVVVGEDAIHMANERNMVAQRPMQRGVLSPKEKNALPIIRLLIKSLIGQEEGIDKLVFSIPAEPIDASFDIFYHEEMMKAYLREMGFDSTSLNEAFAVAFSELLDDNLTGVTISCGAGMLNTAVIFEGDPIVQFSVTKGGDWIDSSVATALDLTSSLVQIEKEESDLDLLKPEGKIQEAVAVYYGILIKYLLDNILYKLEQAKLPSFRNPLPIVLAGGLTLVNNFKKKFELELNKKKLPFGIKEVRIASDPMTCVAHGCLMAAIL